jgi:hypothetical protein
MFGGLQQYFQGWVRGANSAAFAPAASTFAFEDVLMACLI